MLLVKVAASSYECHDYDGRYQALEAFLVLVNRKPPGMAGCNMIPISSHDYQPYIQNVDTPLLEAAMSDAGSFLGCCQNACFENNDILPLWLTHSLSRAL